MMVDPNSYNISIRKTEIEGAPTFEARIKELPDVIEYASSMRDVYDLAIDTIEVTAEHFLEKGQQMPVPSVPSDDYSGRVTLRIPRSLHRALSDTAKVESVSLNQYLVGLLSYFSGFNHCKDIYRAQGWFPESGSRSNRRMHRDQRAETKREEVHLKLVSSCGQYRK